MNLSDFDLQQLDEQKLMALPAKQKDGLLVKLLWDLKEARERLKANSQTSSRPPRSDAPWHGTGSGEEDSEAGAEVCGDARGTEEPEENGVSATSANGVALSAEGKTPASAAAGKRKKAGRIR